MSISAAAVSLSLLRCDGCTRAEDDDGDDAEPNNVRTIIKLDRSMDSMGFVFRCTIVFMTVLLKL